MTTVLPIAAERSFALTIDGQPVQVREGATLLEACRLQGIATPTLCYLENLTPVNVCWVCVVEVEGSRALVPACSRRAESGMVVLTDSPRVRLSRRHEVPVDTTAATVAQPPIIIISICVITPAVFCVISALKPVALTRRTPLPLP
jgi:hypothetical protein